MLAAVTDVFINERKQKFNEWIPNIIKSEVKVRLISLYYYQDYSFRFFLNKGLVCIKRG